ncbi:DUF2970 domain-containing protein [Pseudoalteromonas espejiana]
MRKKRQSDFKQRSPLLVILIAGALFIIFVVAIYAVVAMVLNT